MKCYELKNCCFNGTDPEKSRCQPYKLQISFFEFDWVSLYRAMPDSDEKYEWRDVMLENCPQCEVYKLHKSEVERVLEGLRNS